MGPTAMKPWEGRPSVIQKNRIKMISAASTVVAIEAV